MNYIIREVIITCFIYGFGLLFIYSAKHTDESLWMALKRICFLKWHFYLVATFFSWANAKNSNGLFDSLNEILNGIGATLIWYGITLLILDKVSKKSKKNK